MDWTTPAIAVATVLAALAGRGPANRGLRAWLAWLGRLSRRPADGWLCIGAFALALAATITLTTRWPVPGIHDEFSYLLAADTFAHGRLTNPPHPMWEHLESIHIIVQPTYASKYPPAQGMILAIGQKLCDLPITGVWLANALACVAVSWALRAWLPGGWALLGGLLSALHPLVLEWGQCYWGGAAAMAGGALVLGAYRRITRPSPSRDRRREEALASLHNEPRNLGCCAHGASPPAVRDSLALGAGLLILANSRPFEGLVFAAMIAGALLMWLVRLSQPPWLALFGRLVLPVSAVLAIGGTWMGYYNHRVTGDPLKFPYSVHEAAYSMTPLFVWQKAKPEPAYRHKVIRDFWTGWALDFHKRQQTLKGWAFDCGRKVWTMSKAYLWKLVLAGPLLILPWAWRHDGKARFCVVLLGLFVLVLFHVTWPLQPHYAAPLFTVFLLLHLQCLRRLRLWGRGARPFGSAVVLGLLVACVASVAAFWHRHAQFNEGNSRRVEIIRSLTAIGGKHLVIVRYADNHSPHDEWVYNDADIPGSPVVWARDMGVEKNFRLLEHFERRTVWLLEADKKPRELVSYPVRP